MEATRENVEAEEKAKAAEEAARLAEEKRQAEEAARVEQERKAAEEAALAAAKKREAEAKRVAEEKRAADEKKKAADAAARAAAQRQQDSARQAVAPVADRMFRNEQYSFEISDKGIVSRLTSGGNVLIDQLGGVNLQGSYIGSDGKRTWFYAGGVENSRYTAAVEKSVDASNNTVFTIKTTHPRFTMEQKVTCLDNALDVAVDFEPIDLRDPRGDIAGVYAVWLNGGSLSAGRKMHHVADTFTYTTAAGPLVVTFDDQHWARGGKGEKQLVTAGENFASFYFVGVPETATRSLRYRVALP